MAAGSELLRMAERSKKCFTQESGAGAYKKGMDCNENFDDMVVDEGVSATNVSLKYT